MGPCEQTCMCAAGRVCLARPVRPLAFHQEIPLLIPHGAWVRFTYLCQRAARSGPDPGMVLVSEQMADAEAADGGAFITAAVRAVELMMLMALVWMPMRLRPGHDMMAIWMHRRGRHAAPALDLTPRPIGNQSDPISVTTEVALFALSRVVGSSHTQEDKLAKIMMQRNMRPVGGVTQRCSRPLPATSRRLAVQVSCLSSPPNPRLLRAALPGSCPTPRHPALL